MTDLNTFLKRLINKAEKLRKSRKVFKRHDKLNNFIMIYISTGMTALNFLINKYICRTKNSSLEESAICMCFHSDLLKVIKENLVKAIKNSLAFII